MNGFINVLKPPGMSSAQVVGLVKRILGERKAGHTGTLDPAAAGVLPVCIGRATKFSDYVMIGDKEYIAEITFGLSTDTLDSMGKITFRDENIIVKEPEFKKALNSFIGETTQTVPAYSAVKVNGQPLYKSALRDQENKLPKRRVFIKKAELLSAETNRFLLRITCSKGTYIRALIDDLGKCLNSCAYTSFLLRTKSGNFFIEDSITLDELRKSDTKDRFLISVPDALNRLPKLVLNDYLFDIITTGSAVDTERANLNLLTRTDYLIYCKDVFLGVGREENKSLKLKSVFYLRNGNENTD